MLNAESLKKIDAEIAKYPDGQKQSAVMSALRIAQQAENGTGSCLRIGNGHHFSSHAQCSIFGLTALDQLAT